jgi:CIC family chloride channel protein
MFYSGQLFFLTTNDWSLNALPFYLLLGAFCGLLSTYMVRMTLATEHYFITKKNPWLKALIGGLVIGILLFFFPPLYGEGYGVVNNLMAGNSSSLLDKSLFYQYNDRAWYILLFAGLIILVKVFAAAITIGSGGNGGIFGPSLYTGALGGFFFARFFNLTQITHLNEQNFVVVAMCGLISGALHAPLTGIFLIAEITGGYMLFVPLMVVSSMSYFVTRYFEPNSIYKKTLIERGFIGQNKDSELLQTMNISRVLETDFISIKTGQTLREMIDTVSHSRRNTFPVLNSNNQLEGIVTLEDIKEVMFNRELYDKIHVRELMNLPYITVDIADNMERVMQLFEENSFWNIPVLENGEYRGFISKTGVLNYYREHALNAGQAL